MSLNIFLSLEIGSVPICLVPLIDLYHIWHSAFGHTAAQLLCHFCFCAK